MTMHLLPPMYSTTGKKKGKRKFRNADEARKARALEESWNELLKRHNIQKEQKKRRQEQQEEFMSVLKTGHYVRDTGPRIPSLNNGVDMTPAIKAPDKVYTGTKIIGIGTMHKSNAVPVFSDDEAKEISSMRR